MTDWTRKSYSADRGNFGNHSPYGHWYRDNQVYFITARCVERFPAFASEEAKAIFWDRLVFYTHEALFTPWITSLLGNHYHLLGYCKQGNLLPERMRKIHGSVAKLVNDLLPERRKPFWAEQRNKGYFDGCLRDELQCRRAYRYTLMQSVRHRICTNWRSYPHTRVNIDLERGIQRALELNAFLEEVRYKRYQKRVESE
jgi:REP element-mobilizing transposase RayT